MRDTVIGVSSATQYRLTFGLAGKVMVVLDVLTVDHIREVRDDEEMPESDSVTPSVLLKTTKSVATDDPGPTAQVAHAIADVEPPSEPDPPPVIGLVTGTVMEEFAKAALGTASYVIVFVAVTTGTWFELPVAG